MLSFCAFDIILVFNVLHRLVLLRLFHRSFVSSFIVRRFVMRVVTIYLKHCNVSSAGRMGESGWGGGGGVLGQLSSVLVL